MATSILNGYQNFWAVFHITKINVKDFKVFFIVQTKKKKTDINLRYD